jgi:predicted ATPase
MTFITDIAFTIGPNGTAAPLHMPIGPSVTVFVGPNNSGKSTLLREIYGTCRGADQQANRLLSYLQFNPVDEQTAQAELELMTMPGFIPQPSRSEHVQVGLFDSYDEIHVPSYMRYRVNPAESPQHFAGTYGRFVTRYVDGASRLSLLNTNSLGDLKRPSGLLPRLLADNPKRSLVRQRIFDQLGLYLSLDPTGTPNVSVRLSKDPPPSERSFEESTVAYMRDAPSIDAFSDGVRAFCGLIVQIHVGAPKVMMIDEPEAFLSPPLTHALGREMATAALEEGKQIFVATHSSHFLMGAVAAGAQVNIIRLTYEHGTSGTARLLPAGDLRKLMHDPMLRSANVLSALFYKGAVVGEADSDRAFYQECNERLLATKDSRAAPDTLFLNANGKDVIPMIVEPLRRLGIPAAAVVDLDVVKSGGAVWTRHLAACGLPAMDHATLGQRRGNVLAALNAADPHWKRNGGIQVLEPQAKASAEALFNELDGYGLFVVRRGEVEAWLSNLSVSRSKDSWLREIFAAMGSDPGGSYEQPKPGDVWDFVGSFSSWLRDGSRRGIPQ